MSIKRPLISPHTTQPPRPRTELTRVALKRDEFRAAARSGPTPALPAQDLVPGALVDGVVDGDDGGHVGGDRGVGFALHGGEEHGFGGVDPVAGRGGVDVGAGCGFGVWG